MKYKSALSFLLILNILLFIVWLSGRQLKHNNSTNSIQDYPEIEQLSNKTLSFDQLKVYFTSLSEKKGAIYAYEVLRLTALPLNTDTHLLGHVVGDVLYKQEGLNGIKICTEDFRNACSHSIVVGLFTDKSLDALPQISQACHEAPGGTNAYPMCFHGLGHGILAYTEYDLPKAIEICKKTGTEKYNNQESVQCISGTIMEIISGGDHDKALWSKQREKYLFANNPFYPCSDLVPNEAKDICYIYITPYLWEAVSADLGNPNEEDFNKSFALCNQIPKQDIKYKSSCFGGFGKEFPTLAQNRDIRKIDQMTDEQLSKVYNWCQLANDKDGTQSCLSVALSSIYWGGENDRQASIRFCRIMRDSQQQSSCFNNLINTVSYYIHDSVYKKNFCQELPSSYQTDCRNKLAV